MIGTILKVCPEIGSDEYFAQSRDEMVKGADGYYTVTIPHFQQCSGSLDTPNGYWVLSGLKFKRRGDCSTYIGEWICARCVTGKKDKITATDEKTNHVEYAAKMQRIAAIVKQYS